MGFFQFLAASFAMEDAVRDYRIFGQRLRPLSVSIERKLEDLSYFFVGAPAAAASIWKSPDSQDLGVLVSNSSAVAQTLTVTVPFADYGMTGTWTVHQTDASSARTTLGTAQATVSIPVTLAPYSVQFFELTPGP